MLWEILNKYDESIKLSYNYAYRMLVHLKNITKKFNNIKDPDDITTQVYRDYFFSNSLL